MDGLLVTSLQPMPTSNSLHWVYVVANCTNGALYYFSDSEEARAFCLASESPMNNRGLQFIAKCVNPRDLMDLD